MKLTNKLLIALAVAGTTVFGSAPFTAFPGITATCEAAAVTDFELAPIKGGDSTTILNLCADKPLYLNFWASWCPPCVGEMPAISNMQQKYGDKVNFAAISVDDTLDEAAAFVNGRGAALTVPFYYGDVRAICNAYRLQAIPVSLIVAPGGEIIKMQIGGMSEIELDRFIKQAL